MALRSRALRNIASSVIAVSMDSCGVAPFQCSGPRCTNAAKELASARKPLAVAVCTTVSRALASLPTRSARIRRCCEVWLRKVV